MTQFGVTPWLGNPKFRPPARAVTHRLSTPSTPAAEKEPTFADGYAKGLKDGEMKGYRQGFEQGRQVGIIEGSARVAEVEKVLAERGERSGTIHEIAKEVAKRHGITLGELRGHRRARHLCAARHEAMALAMADGRRTAAQVAAYFDGRDHTTVIHAVRKLAARAKPESDG